MKPRFDLNKIKFATDESTYHKAIGLYESGKVKDFKEELDGFSAIVLGTSPYSVFVANGQYDDGSCECYLGQNDTLCKHMVALAIHAVLGGKPLKKEDKEVLRRPKCSGKHGKLSKEQLVTIEKSLSMAIKYIKPYNGPSKIWFAYQNSLSEGCNRLSAIISELPVNIETSGLIVKLLLRLDKKLTSGGVDDSNGTVGGFIEEAIGVLQEYAKLEPLCIESFKLLLNQETCFGWEEPLLKIYDQIKQNN
ncbi:MAG: hypothetical protein HY425_02090 [Candidatus Levybacteria bacterium]|nr:hypothetical protein [Candidatus Levybacteria bacterium]